MKTHIRHLLLCLFVIAGLQFLSAFALAADSAGMVLSVVNGAWLERDGQKQAVQSKDRVLVNDIVSTDANGKVQILFNDNTVIAIGNNSSVAVADFVFDDATKKDSFSAKMTQGVARFVTGKIVERNRDGFSVKTPSATVGIRGTTFAVEVSSGGVTDVIGLSINPAFPVSVTNSTTGLTDVIDKNGLAVKAASAGNTSYMAPAGKLASLAAAVKINGGAASGAEKAGADDTSSSSSDKKAGGSSEGQDDSDTSGDSGDSDASSDGGSGSDSGGGATASSPAQSSAAGNQASGPASAVGAGDSMGGNSLGSAISDATPGGGISSAAVSSGAMPASAMRLVAAVPSPATDMVSPDKSADDIYQDLVLNDGNGSGGTIPGGDGGGGTPGGGGTNPPVNPGIVYQASYAGNLNKSGVVVGDFSFNINLLAGAGTITGAKAQYKGPPQGSGPVLNFKDGIGTIRDGAFNNLVIRENGTGYYGNRLSMDGTVDTQGLGLLQGGQTSGNWSIYDYRVGEAPSVVDKGSFEGNQRP